MAKRFSCELRIPRIATLAPPRVSSLLSTIGNQSTYLNVYNLVAACSHYHYSLILMTAVSWLYGLSHWTAPAVETVAVTSE
jgi:hypothetical protein